MSVVLGEGNAQMHSISSLLCLFMSVVLGGRECADAFRLISVLSFYVCCFGGKGMRRCIPFDLCLLFGGGGMRICILFVFCFVFLCLLFWGRGMCRCIPFDFCSVFLCLLFWGERECADAFRLISVLSFYVCCFGGKGMRRCIPFDLCLLFGGRECADAF